MGFRLQGFWQLSAIGQPSKALCNFVSTVGGFSSDQVR